MNIVQDAGRVISRTADATTAAAGALGGAAVGGVIGGLQGTATGLKNGLSSGSHSTPAAALTLAAIGAAGLVEWPVLLAVGGTALVVHQLSHQSDGKKPEPASAAATSTRRHAAAPGNAASKPSQRSPRKSTRTTRR
jgi:hypothetical protein